ncbi:MAG: hypothetical protein H0U70_01480 [Tatlockia sp.]|nr:hypothetical protein [Tatlockia sp.]
MSRTRVNIENLREQGNELFEKTKHQQETIESNLRKINPIKSVKTKLIYLQSKIEQIRSFQHIKGVKEFVDCLKGSVNNPRHQFSKIEREWAINFADTSCDLLRTLLSKPDKHALYNCANSLNLLKTSLPPTTFGRCVLGIINALLVPFFAVLETLKLLGGDAEYRYTKSTARDCYYLFKSPVHPAFELLDDMYNFVKNGGTVEPEDTISKYKIV